MTCKRRQSSIGGAYADQVRCEPVGAAWAPGPAGRPKSDAAIWRPGGKANRLRARSALRYDARQRARCAPTAWRVCAAFRPSLTPANHVDRPTGIGPFGQGCPSEGQSPTREETAPSVSPGKVTCPTCDVRGRGCYVHKTSTPVPQHGEEQNTRV